MAIRIRKDGKILCAKYHKVEEGDIYIDDAIHEYLTGCNGIIPLEEAPLCYYNSKIHQWFWRWDKDRFEKSQAKNLKIME